MPLDSQVQGGFVLDFVWLAKSAIIIGRQKLTARS